MKIVFCTLATHPERDEFIAQNAYRALNIGEVDAVVLVNGGNHIFEIQDWDKVHTVSFPWRDNFPESRNQYLRGVDRLQATWSDDILICVADADEFYSDKLWRQIRHIADWAVEQDKNQIAIQCHSITLNLAGARIQEHIDDYWKGLILLWEPEIKYIATGPDRITPSESSFVHEFLVIPTGTRYVQLSDPTLYYEHTKTIGDVWFRAARNVWAGGGGPNLGIANPWWQPFRTLVQSVAPYIQTSVDWENYLKEGNIHPRVKEEILSFRHIGTAHDPRTSLWPTWPDGTSEWREIAMSYFALLHPDQLPPEIVTEDKGKIDWYAEIERIHGTKIPQPV